MDIEYLMQSAGFTEKEVEVYLALLPKGKAPASLLAKELGIPRSTAKFTCDQLVKKQLVQQSQYKNTTFYVPEHPKRIMYLIDRQQEHLTDTREELERNMGQLEKIYNPHTTLPKVRFFQGEELEEMFLNLAKQEETERLAFSAGGHFAKILPEASKRYREAIKKLKQKARVLRPKEHKDFNKADSNIQAKTFATIEDLKAHIVMVGDVITISSVEPGKSVGIWIEHEEIAQGFKQIFEELWDARS